MEDEWFEIIFIGDCSVGKTNIMSKYLKNEFNHNSYATLGVDYHQKHLRIENHTIQLQMWDTSGNERFKPLTSNHYKRTKAVIIVYDITHKDSFNSVDKWLKDYISINGNDSIIILIGNKLDLKKKRQVTKEEGELKAKQLKAEFFEVSALTGENIDKVFEMLKTRIYKKFFISKK